MYPYLLNLALVRIMSEIGLDTVVNTRPLREGQVRYQPPLTWDMPLGNHAQSIQLETRDSTLREGAQHVAHGSLFLDVLVHYLGMLQC